MLTYSISKGAFAPVSLEGATIREDRRSLVAIYGRAAVMQAALSGRLPVPPAARPFLAVVDGIVQRKSILERTRRLRTYVRMVRSEHFGRRF